MIRAVIAVLILVAAVAVHAQSPGAPTTSEQVRRQLLAIEADVARANSECDYAFFRRIEAPEFIFTAADGGVTTRAEDLAGESACRKNSYRTTIDEPRLIWYQQTAVLSARSSVALTDREGHPVIRRSRFTDVFIWRDKRWQMVAGHSSRIPPDTTAHG